MTGAPPRPPAPTVRHASRRTARALHLAGAWALVTGVCGGASLLVIGLRAPAEALAFPCLAAAAALHAAGIAAAARARRLRVSPAAAIPVLALAGAAAWLTLPLAGLPWLRAPAAAAAAAAMWPAAAAGLRHRRRRAVEQRIAQALSTELAQSASQVEQVLGGLAGVLRPERATAPYYGIAPHAAWDFRGTRWDGTRILGAALYLPAHAGIAMPDFLARIRRALAERAGLANVRLSPDPLRDLITMDFDPPPDPAAAGATRRQAAADRARTAIAQVLHQKDGEVTVEVLDWAEDEAPPGSVLAWPMRRFTVSYAQTPKVTSGASQELLRAHMSLQLYGEESALRADWRLAADEVVFTRRTEFPGKIVHRPVDVAGAFGALVVIPHATDEDGNLVGWQWTETDAPHELVSGPTGTGKSVDLRTVMIEAARQGHEVRGIDPKRVEMRGLRGWPNVTRIATRVPDMIAVIDDTFDEMMDRYDKIEQGTAAAGDFRMIGLMIDEYIMFTMLVSDWWAEKENRGGSDSKEHPVFRKLVALFILARGANIRLRIHSQRVDAALFADRALGGVRDNIAARVALGRQTKESAGMMFGDSTAGRDIPLGAVAVGTVLGPAGRVRAKMHWLPDPADWGRLPPAERQLLLDMLPPGAAWDGPQPYRPAAAEADGPARPNPARRLLFFARTALRTREAYLTSADGGGPPADGPAASFYGWSLSAAGQPEHSGTWIGCTAGPRVYLYPDRVLDVVRRLAEPLEVPFPYTRQDLDAALHASGLLNTEQGPDGKVRWTVRRQLPGNDLGLRDDRQRVWDLPAGELVGDTDTEVAPDAVAAAQAAAAASARRTAGGTGTRAVTPPPP